MKNLKKIAALVVVLAMALSSVAFAAAFSDVSEDASYNEAVQVMASLGLLKGDPEGTFRPDATITRAEFAAVVVRALGMEDAAAGASVNTIFTDVPADHWASGYVQIANQQGIILGYGDGNFGPDDEVLYEQAVKMIECALNYGVKFANVPDAYPTSYLAQANADGITVGASGKIGDKASRAVVARLVYNALDVPMMVQTTIGGNNGDEFQVENYTTLLTSKLKIAKVEGTVKSLYFNKDQADQIAFEVTKEDKKYDEKNGVDTMNDITTLTYGEDIDVASMRGYSCVAYVDMDDDSDMVLKAIAPKAGKNKTLTLTTKQVDVAKEGEISYYKNDSTDEKALKIRLADGDKPFVAYENNNTSEMGIDDFIAAYNDKDFSEVVFIDNGNDNRYDIAILKTYGSFVVDSVNTNTNRIKANGSALRTYTESYLELDPDDDDTTYKVLDVNGKVLSLEDIKSGDVVNIAESTDGTATFYEIIVNSEKVSGSVAEKRTDDGETYYKIDGKEYTVPGRSGATYLTLGAEGTFTVDLFGNVLYKELEATSSQFGLLYNVDIKKEFGNTYRASVLNEKGEFSVYEFAEKVKIDGAESGVKLDEDSNWATITAMAKDLVIYGVNSSGKITAIATDYRKINNDYSAVEPEGKLEYKAGTGKLGKYLVDESAYLFNYKGEDISDGEKADFTVVKSSAFVDEQEYTFAKVVYDRSTNQILAALGLKVSAAADVASPAMFVTSTGKGTDAAGDEVDTITGYVEGSQVTIKVNEDTDGIDGHTFAKGDVIQYNADSNGMASGVNVLFTADQIKKATAVEEGKDGEKEFFKSGKVAEIADKFITFRGSGDVDDETGLYKNNLDVYLTSDVPTIKVTLDDKGEIRSVSTKVAVDNVKADADFYETDDEGKVINPAPTENTDTLFIYKYDDDEIIAVIVTK